MRGIKVDYEKIAAGIYEMMLKHLDENYLGALSLGMLPAPLMDSAERNFIDKCWELMGYSAAADRQEAKKFGLDIDREAVREFMHGVSMALLRLAEKKGILQV